MADKKNSVITRPSVGQSSEASGTPLALPDTLMSRDSNADTATNQLNTHSLAVGDQALVRIPGTAVFAHGRFGNTGDAQRGIYLLRTHTVSSMWTEAFLDGTAGSQRLVLPDDSTWTFEIMITGHRTDDIDGHAGYKVTGVIYRQSGAATTSFQGKPTKQTISESDSLWDINIEADNLNGCLKISVKGETGKIIRWVAAVTTVEVTN